MGRPDDRWFPAPASTRLPPGAWRVSFKTLSPVSPGPLEIEQFREGFTNEKLDFTSANWDF